MDIGEGESGAAKSASGGALSHVFLTYQMQILIVNNKLISIIMTWAI